MAQVITIGETMVSFTPDEKVPLRYASNYRQRIAGAESNVAIGLQKLGHSSAWISKLGTDEFGQYVYNMIRAEGVDVNMVLFDKENPTGVMFKETGQGESKVYYYRQLSAASTMKADDIKKNDLLQADILHITGITPVLSESCKYMIEKAVKIANENNRMVSFDPNIRKKLWKGHDYTPMIMELCMKSDIVLLGLDEAQLLFHSNEITAITHYLFEKGNAKFIAVKDGANGAWVADKSAQYHIPPYTCRCIDTIGAGDAFNAAFLAGILENKNVKECGEMGAAAGASATETNGDIEGFPDRSRLYNRLTNQKETYR